VSIFHAFYTDRTAKIKFTGIKGSLIIFAVINLDRLLKLKTSIISIIKKMKEFASFKIAETIFLSYTGCLIIDVMLSRRILTVKYLPLIALIS